MSVSTQLNTVPYTISPSAPDASGNQQPVDLKAFPTALTGIVWKGDNDAVGTVAAAADGLSAVVTRVAPGKVNVTVSAVNVKGDTLSQSDDVTFEQVVPVVNQLGLAAGTPA